MQKRIPILMLLFVMMTVMMTASFSQAVEPVEPMDAVKPAVEKAISILRDPQYKEASNKERQREDIWNVIKEFFDFVEISARSLGAGWRNFTVPQRQEFTQVFSELLKNTYLDKLQGAYQNEEIVFVGQDKITNDKAVVLTKVLREKIEILMDYSLRLRDNEWKVYDVSIEGVSMVKNYRTQFKDILFKESPDQLIKQLKEKNKAHLDNRTSKTNSGS